jgi:hypothetical protein
MAVLPAEVFAENKNAARDERRFATSLPGCYSAAAAAVVTAGETLMKRPFRPLSWN